MANAIIIEPYDLAAVTAEGSAAGTSPANLNNDWIGVVHRGTSTTTAAVVNADLGVARPVDTVAFLSALPNPATHTIIGGTASGASDVYTSGAQTFAAGATLPTTGRRNSLWMLNSPVTARHWGASFSALGGTPFEAGRLVIGQRIQLARNFSFGATIGVRDFGGADFSRQSVWLPSAGGKLRTLALSFTRATKQEAEEVLHGLLQRIGNTDMILVVTDPDPGALRQSRMFFGPLIGNVETVWQVADGWEWRANLLSVI